MSKKGVFIGLITSWPSCSHLLSGLFQNSKIMTFFFRPKIWILLSLWNLGTKQILKLGQF